MTESEAEKEFESQWCLMSLWASTFFGGTVSNKTIKEFSRQLWLAAWRKYGRGNEEGRD